MATPLERAVFQEMADDMKIKEQCVHGYSTDPWFQKLDNIRKFTVVDGLFVRNGAIVVPHLPDLRKALLRLSHDDKHAGHGGIAKTLHLLTRSFWWKGVRQDVQDYVDKCLTCQTTKARNHLPYGKLLPLPIPDLPWQVVTMDFVTGLPLSPAGFDGVMVITDKLTRMVHFKPITKLGLTAEVVANIIVTDIHRLHGIPEKIICDRDRVFSSQYFQQVQDLVGCSTRMSTAYHPETDGATERVNRTLEDYLRSFADIRSGGGDWSEHLPWAEFSFNNSFHTATGATPFQLNYGRNPRSPITYVTPSYAPGSKPNWDAQDLARRIAESLSVAKSCLIAAQDRDKHYADLKRKAFKVKPGQWVLLSTKNLTRAARLSEEDTKEVRRKLFPRFMGPFKVLETFPQPSPETPDIIPTPSNVRLDLPQKFKNIHPIFHVNLIREYKADPDTVPPTPEWDGTDEWYEVESILDHRTTGKKGRKRTDFKIRWAGYTSFYDSWEPQREIQRRAPEAIRAYWTAHPEGRMD